MTNMVDQKQLTPQQTASPTLLPPPAQESASAFVTDQEVTMALNERSKAHAKMGSARTLTTTEIKQENQDSRFFAYSHRTGAIREYLPSDKLSNENKEALRNETDVHGNKFDNSGCINADGAWVKNNDLNVYYVDSQTRQVYKINRSSGSEKSTRENIGELHIDKKSDLSLIRQEDILHASGIIKTADGREIRFDAGKIEVEVEGKPAFIVNFDRQGYDNELKREALNPSFVRQEAKSIPNNEPQTGNGPGTSTENAPVSPTASAEYKKAETKFETDIATLKQSFPNVKIEKSGTVQGLDQSVFQVYAISDVNNGSPLYMRFSNPKAGDTKCGVIFSSIKENLTTPGTDRSSLRGWAAYSWKGKSESQQFAALNTDQTNDTGQTMFDFAEKNPHFVGFIQFLANSINKKDSDHKIDLDHLRNRPRSTAPSMAAAYDTAYDTGIGIDPSFDRGEDPNLVAGTK